MTRSRDLGFRAAAAAAPAADRRRYRTRPCAARSRRTGTPCRSAARGPARRCRAPASDTTVPPIAIDRRRRRAPGRRRSAASWSCRSRSGRAARSTALRAREGDAVDPRLSRALRGASKDLQSPVTSSIAHSTLRAHRAAAREEQHRQHEPRSRALRARPSAPPAPPGTGARAAPTSTTLSSLCSTSGMVNSRTPMMNRSMKPEDSAGAAAAARCAAASSSHRAPEAAEASSSSVWICMRPARAEPRRGGEAVGVGDQQNPDRAVDADRHRQDRGSSLPGRRSRTECRST